MTQRNAEIRLKAGKDRSLLRRHPWVFSGAVAHVKGSPAAGDMVAVRSDTGEFLGWAAIAPHSQIRARVWSFDEEAPVTPAWVGQRIHEALNRRERVALRSTAIRLIHGEADGLPGLICDRYGDWLVLQFNSAGAHALRDVIIAELRSHTGLSLMYERSDSDAVALEGLQVAVGPLTPEAKSASKQAGAVAIVENRIHYEIDLAEGHKTGFYVDQRENRALVGRLARGRVLNCFSYTGGFSLAALKAGADAVVSVDSSEPAMRLAQKNAALNGVDVGTASWEVADVFKYLRQCRANNERFDLIVLDPPKFAPNAASVDRACRAYKDINLLGMQLLNPGGDLLTFSCSGVVSPELFRKVIAGAAADARVSLEVMGALSAGEDHPVLLEFPEGEYLKGLHLRKRA